MVGSVADFINARCSEPYRTNLKFLYMITKWVEKNSALNKNSFLVLKREYSYHTNSMASDARHQYPKRRLFVRSREVSKPRDWYFKLLYRFEIWLAHRQQCCRSACHISERSDNSKYKSRGFETSRDLTIRCLFGYWDGALTPSVIKSSAIIILTGCNVATLVFLGCEFQQIMNVQCWGMM